MDNGWKILRIVAAACLCLGLIPSGAASSRSSVELAVETESMVSTAVTADCNPNAAPALISPDHQSVNTLVPLFKWYTVNGVQEYWLQVGLKEDFSVVIDANIWNVGAVTQANLILSYNLKPNTTYYWRVAAHCSNPSSMGPYSVTTSFTIGIVPGTFLYPSAIFNPTDGAELSDGNIKFSWGSVTGAAGVQYCFHTTRQDAVDDPSCFFNNAVLHGWDNRWYTSIQKNFDYLKPVTLYWSIRILNNNGWGEDPEKIKIHSVSIVSDVGFRPYPNGYRFNNTGEYPVSTNEITIDDLINWFGYDRVCITITECIRKLELERWMNLVNKRAPEGHCLGISSTSLDYYRKDAAFFENLQSNASKTYDLRAEGKVKWSIDHDQALRFTVPLKNDIISSLKKTPNTLLSSLKASFINNAPDPFILVVFKNGSETGHAVVPYKLRVDGNIAIVYIYDSNSPYKSEDPNKSVRFISFDTEKNAWVTNLGYSSYDGDKIGIFPLSKVKQKPTNIVFTPASGVTAQSTPLINGAEVWADNIQNVWISSESGLRLGYIAGELYEEIPDGMVVPGLGGLGVSSGPIMDIPPGTGYTIHLDGSAKNPVTDASVTQLSEGFVAASSHISVSAGQSDTLTILPDGSKLTYAASETKVVDLSLGIDLAAGTGSIEISGFPLTAGQSVSLGSAIASHTFQVDASRAGTGTYTLDMTFTTLQGIAMFYHSPVPILAGDTQTLDYGNWSGEAITLAIDHGSDGRIDETIDLENQVSNLYLPAITR